MESVRTRINDNWSFAKLGECSSDDIDSLFGTICSIDSINVPHIWENGFNGKAAYFRSIHMEKSQLGNDVFIRFEGVNVNASVYVNSLSAGIHHGGEEAFSVKITDFLHSGENELTVVVDNIEDTAAGDPEKDFGIFSDVWLVVNARAD